MTSLSFLMLRDINIIKIKFESKHKNYKLEGLKMKWENLISQIIIIIKARNGHRKEKKKPSIVAHYQI